MGTTQWWSVRAGGADTWCHTHTHGTVLGTPDGMGDASTSNILLALGSLKASRVMEPLCSQVSPPQALSAMNRSVSITKLALLALLAKLDILSLWRAAQAGPMVRSIHLLLGKNDRA